MADQTTNRPESERAPETMGADSAPGSSRRRRLLFRATHRGTHEADLLIGGFVAPRLDSFTTSELDELEALLERPDVVLADWLCGRLPVPAYAHGPMLAAMIEAAGKPMAPTDSRMSSPEQ